MNDGLAGGGDGVEKFDRESGLRRERERERGGGREGGRMKCEECHHRRRRPSVRPPGRGERARVRTTHPAVGFIMRKVRSGPVRTVRIRQSESVGSISIRNGRVSRSRGILIIASLTACHHLAAFPDERVLTDIAKVILNST